MARQTDPYSTRLRSGPAIPRAAVPMNQLAPFRGDLIGSTVDYRGLDGATVRAVVRDVTANGRVMLELESGALTDAAITDIEVL